MTRKEQIEEWARLVSEYGLDRVRWRFRYANGLPSSFFLTELPDFNHGEEYEFDVIQPTGTSREMELPLAERRAPEKGTGYWTPEVDDTGEVTKLVWFGDQMDDLYLRRGFVYLRKEDAVAVAKASTRHNEWVVWDE